LISSSKLPSQRNIVPRREILNVGVSLPNHSLRVSNCEWECLLTRLPHLKCFSLFSVRSSHLPFEMHQIGYVRSSLPILMHVVSIATPI